MVLPLLAEVQASLHSIRVAVILLHEGMAKLAMDQVHVNSE